MELNDLSKIAADQDKGHWFDLPDPVSGDATGIRLLICGPDSERAKKANIDLGKALERLSARPSDAEKRIALMNKLLFSLVLDWTITEKGKPVPFTEENFYRLINAGMWVRGFVDTFAGDRRPYFQAGA